MERPHLLPREDTLTNQLERVNSNIAFWEEFISKPDYKKEAKHELKELYQIRTEITTLLKKIKNEESISIRPNGWPTKQ